MKIEAVAPAKSTPTAIQPKPLDVDKMFRDFNKLYERVAKRAFELFTRRGFENGHDLDDWFQAERELLHPAATDVRETENEFTLKANVAGFRPEELDIRVEGNRVVINGKNEAACDDKSKMACAECTTRQLYRSVQLPAAVVADKATAKLENGMLELKLPKEIESKKVGLQKAS